MRRILKSFPAVLLAGIMATATYGAPPGAGLAGTGGESKERPAHPRGGIQREGAPDSAAKAADGFGERRASLAAAVMNEPEGIPPMFREMFPHRVSALERMARERPEEYRMTCRHLHRMAQELNELKGRDQEEYDRRVEILKTEQDVDGLAEKYRVSQGAEGEKIAADLRGKLEKLFDLKEKSQRAHLARMESHLKEMRDKLDKRHKNKSLIIEKRLNDLKTDTDLEF